MQNATMRVEIWSDISCPWCYIGKARLKRALTDFDHRDEVELVHRSFELDPQLAKTVSTTSPEHAEKYGLNGEEARAAEQRLADLANAEGLPYLVESRDHGNTFDLHRLLHLAAAHGLQEELLDALYAANFGSDRSVYDSEYQFEIAISVGLPSHEVRAVIADREANAEAVRDDEAQAAGLGISGVPFFVIDGKYGLSGAQPVEVFLQALETAWTDGGRQRPS
jgi:predicted DsbA family dithiol-disulfide isomerase